jgi:hypothetical protein
VSRHLVIIIFTLLAASLVALPLEGPPAVSRTKKTFLFSTFVVDEQLFGTSTIKLFHPSLIFEGQSRSMNVYQPWNPYWRGSLNTVDLLVLTNINKLPYLLEHFLSFYKTSYLNEEVICIELSPSVRYPGSTDQWNSTYLCNRNISLQGADLKR